MKSHYLVLILSFIFGYTSAQNDTTEILDFPPYSNEVSYSGCDEILAKTPSAEDLIIYSDSVIDFQNIDPRVPLKLKFNWVYKDFFSSIGVESFEIIKDNQSIDKIDLKDLIHMEAANYIEENGEMILRPQKTIYLTDLNLDSFLDIGMTEGCGRSCHNIYWYYDPINQTYQRDHTSYRPIKYECKDDKIIVYTYADWMQWYSIYNAYIIHQDSLEFYQSFEFNAGYQGEKYYLHIYENANGDTIKIDTIPKTH
jgi:hypothetical protein